MFNYQNRAYLDIKQIPGTSDNDACKKQIEIYDFNFNVSVPISSPQGQDMTYGTKTVSHFTFKKMLDQTSLDLHQMIGLNTMGESVTTVPDKQASKDLVTRKIQVNLVRQGPSGPVVFATYVLYDPVIIYAAQDHVTNESGLPIETYQIAVKTIGLVYQSSTADGKLGAKKEMTHASAGAS